MYLSRDTRRCAARAADILKRRLEEDKAELERLNRMFRFEEEVWEMGYNLVAGVDEAGRGPLAGPVVAAAVVLRPGCYIRGLNDSKQLQPAERQRLFDIIRECAVAVGIGIKGVEYIERHNIAQASFAAMRDAILRLAATPEFVLVDGFKIPGLMLPQRAIVKGDALSASIAAASIVAKVTRDRIMDGYDRVYPAYGFARNKGYSTREHLQALDTHGPSPVHRRTFCAVIRAQMTLEGLDEVRDE